jgi:hypothetical protein
MAADGLGIAASALDRALLQQRRSQLLSQTPNLNRLSPPVEDQLSIEPGPPFSVIIPFAA